MRRKHNKKKNNKKQKESRKKIIQSLYCEVYNKLAKKKSICVTFF